MTDHVPAVASPTNITTVLGGRGIDAFTNVRRACETLGEGAPFVVVNGEAHVRPKLPANVPEGSAVLLKTSGSTGAGSLVAISAEALLASALATNTALGGPGTWVTCLPTDHIAGFQTVARSIGAGFEPVYAGSGRPEQLAKAAESCGNSRLYLSLVPTQLARLLDSPHLDAARRFNTILVGGASTPPVLLARAQEAGLAIRTTYGMTETCGGCVYDGAPLEGTRVSLEAGRVRIDGPCVAIGYADGEAFGGSFLTNDLGRFVDGKLQILGRSDDAFTSGGETILPGPIEHALVELGAGECIVLSVPHPEWGEAAIAVTLNPVDEAACRAAIAKKLGRAWAPHRIVAIKDLGQNSLPTTPSGKPSRKATAALVMKDWYDIPCRLD